MGYAEQLEDSLVVMDSLGRDAVVGSGKFGKAEVVAEDILGAAVAEDLHKAVEKQLPAGTSVDAVELGTAAAGIAVVPSMIREGPHSRVAP